MHLYRRLLSRLAMMALVLLRLRVMDLLLAIAARAQGGVGLHQRKCFPLQRLALSWKTTSQENEKQSKFFQLSSSILIEHR
jgi:hypothetical protein